jgi:hypothetical protein
MKTVHSFKNYGLAILLLLVLSSLQTKAQLLAAANPTRKSKMLPKLYAGAKIGANFSYLSGNNWDNGIKSNIVGGAFAGIKGLGLGVQAEALFEQSECVTGGSFYSLYKEYYNNINDSLRKGSFKVNKLCLPLLVQIRLARLVWLQTGVQFYGIINVQDNEALVKDAKELFKSGSTSGILGATVHLGQTDIGARAIFDFQNLNNLNRNDVWRQYLFQVHVGVKLF